MNKNTLLISGILFLFMSLQHGFADVFLTSENLNASLKQMQRSQLQMQNQEDYENALYTLGTTADDLAFLLTDEVKAHGAENEKLIELALDRTEKIQVNISWKRENQSFYYDGKALYDYLNLYPQGQFLSDVQFRIIKKEFFHADTDGETAILDAIDTKKQFIKSFPDFIDLSEVELYLAIDYRDLWRHYRDIQLDDQLLVAADHTRQQFQKIIDKYQGEEEGEIAKRLLDRFLAESTSQP